MTAPPFLDRMEPEVRESASTNSSTGAESEDPMSTDITPDAEIITVVETAEERTKREAQEKSNKRWAIAREMQIHLDRMEICLDMLLDSAPSDKAALVAIALRLRSHYQAALELVPEHRAVDGSEYEVRLQPFERLYRTS
jgi:hypothetical protein